MKNRIQNGKVLDYVNGTGTAILSGSLVIFGVLFGIAVTDIAIGETGAVELQGVFELPKATGAITQGAKVYWDATAGKITTTASTNTAIGAASEAALSGDATVKVLLVNGI
jgi:predicted RecA/RadA family phage recombinase